MINGSYVAEGSMFELSGSDVPRTTDVVFIVEAKPCNHNLPVSKSMTHIIAAMEKAFDEVGLHNARLINKIQIAIPLTSKNVLI